MKTQLAPCDLALILGVVTIWGLAFVPMKLALETVPPLALAALRFSLVAFPWVFFIRRPPVGWTTLAGYGLAIGAFQFGLLFLGLKLVVWSSLAAPLPLAIASYVTEGGPAVMVAITHMSLLTWGYILFMSSFATLFGLAAWNRLLHRYPAGLIAPYALLIPVSGLLSGALFLSESLSPLQLAGAGLVFARLACNVYGARFSGWIFGAP